ncbi:ectonucleoside triphosphate diphosphohydrolase 1 [Chanos chanos]|uniref:Ectonucleoside triphosphate diphosphohydrolase 1 n=1 Tax=Chanos chanos TaxID=29144 RepID=A0A6J2VE76_CHACN|nr:ectonucleoside triphosphate diphosphohydrolase 1 [Chanos chanos]
MDEQREMKVKNPWHRPVIILIIVLIAIGIVVMVATAIIQNKPLHQKYKYGIVLDAGSSHTSVFIYEWPAEKENNTGMVRQKHACDVKGKGISSYSGNPAGAGSSLTDCMAEAQKIIPVHRHQETPVYLGATAGMRLLRMEDSSLSDQVLDAVERSLQTYPFDYQGARIITGQEEGAFGWITVNYLSDNFRKASGTIGALDLGGASTQITFVSKENSENPENSMDFRLYGNPYHLYTHSFLCYGKDQVLKLALAKKLQSLEMQEDVLKDACFHHGYKANKTLSSVFNTPCVSEKLADSPKSFIHWGTGDGVECQNAVRKVFNHSCCQYSTCSFNGVYQPPVEGHFGAFSAFYFVMNFLNLTNDDLETAKAKLINYCSTPWEEIKSSYPSVKEKYLAEYCFSGTYILTLLEDGYNFTSTTFKNIEFIKKIADSDAGWTLGYMLNLTNMIPAEAPDTPPLPHGGFVSLMLVLSLLIFSLVIVGYKCFRRPVVYSSAPKDIV